MADRDKAAREPFPWRERRGRHVYRPALEKGVLSRPLGDLTCFVPPRVVTPAEIESVAAVGRAGIDLATAD